MEEEEKKNVYPAQFEFSGRNGFLGGNFLFRISVQTQRERKFSFRKLQIVISQTADFDFANYRFFISQTKGLPFERKIRLECRKHNGKRFTSLPQKCHIRYGLNPKKGEFVSRESGTEKELRNWLTVSNIPFGSYQLE